MPFPQRVLAKMPTETMIAAFIVEEGHQERGVNWEPCRAWRRRPAMIAGQTIAGTAASPTASAPTVHHDHTTTFASDTFVDARTAYAPRTPDPATTAHAATATATSPPAAHVGARRLAYAARSPP